MPASALRNFVFMRLAIFIAISSSISGVPRIIDVFNSSTALSVPYLLFVSANLYGLHK